MKKILLTIFLICAIALSASAHEIPDLDKKGSICVEMHYQGNPISGGNLTIYQAGSIQENNGDYTFVLTSQFAQSDLSLDNVQSPALAEELASIAKEKKLSGITRTIDSNGRVRFEDLQPGLYLVQQHKNSPGYYAINPFLVSLPSLQSGKYIYEVDASPKISPIPRPQNGEIPKTGQSGWSIWIFSAGSVMLAALLLSRKNVNRRNRQ